MPTDISIGKAIQRARQAKGLKLRAVSRTVSVATLNAIEHGRMIPSLTVADAIAAGLGLMPGALDVPLLLSIHDDRQRTQLVDRLLARGTGSKTVQHTLRRIMHDTERSPRHRRHAQWLLARLLAQRGSWRRVVILLEHLLGQTPPSCGALRVLILSTLGQAYLHQNQPQRSLKIPYSKQ